MINKNLYLPTGALLFAVLLSLTGGCGKDAANDSQQAETLERTTTTQKADESPPAGGGDIVAGKLVYEKHCHYCHGRKGRGKGAVSVAVKPNPADFIRDEKRMAVTDEALYKAVSKGITKESGGQKLEKALAMPPFMGILTPKERWDVIAYIRKLVKEAKSEELKK